MVSTGIGSDIIYLHFMVPINILDFTFLFAMWRIFFSLISEDNFKIDGVFMNKLFIYQRYIAIQIL